MDKNLKRISLMIRADQAEKATSSGLNLSGLVRDLLDDHFSEHKIVLSVDQKTKELYEHVISNTGSTDADLEIYIKDALLHLLKDKIQQMQELERNIRKQRS